MLVGGLTVGGLRAGGLRLDGRKKTSFDPGAADYFARREALGGDFASAGYTAAQAKSFFNDWYVAAKDLGFWDAMVEVYWLIGGTFDGLMAKGKYLAVPTMTNNGFVSGDFQPELGLVGDSSSFINTGFASTNLPQNDISISAYCTAAHTQTNNSGWISDNSSLSQSSISCFSTTGNTFTRLRDSSTPETGIAEGMKVAYRNLSNGFSVKENNNSPFFKTATSQAVPSLNFVLFGRSASIVSAGNMTLAFAHVGTGLTDTQAADLSSTTNALMTAFGSNVY